MHCIYIVYVNGTSVTVYTILSCITILVPYCSYIVKIPVHCIALLSISYT